MDAAVDERERYSLAGATGVGAVLRSGRRTRMAGDRIAVERATGVGAGAKTERRIVLVGGGLPHLHCLRQMACAPLPRARVTVVSPVASLVYSGMLPGWMAGHYALDRCCVPIDALARAAGAHLVRGAVGAVDPVRRRVFLDPRSEERRVG